MTVCEGATGETEQIRKVEGLAQLEVDTGRWRMCIHGQPTNRTTSPFKIDTFQSIAAQSESDGFKKNGRESSKAPSLYAVVLRAVVFHSKTVRSNRNH